MFNLFTAKYFSPENQTIEIPSREDIDEKYKWNLIDIYSSDEAWEKDFRATGSLRGIGWAILAQDNETGKLFNVWVNEHDGGHLAGASCILVMDVFEHAFALDYGIKRADYLAAFWKAIDWDVVNSRLAGV